KGTFRKEKGLTRSFACFSSSGSVARAAVRYSYAPCAHSQWTHGAGSDCWCGPTPSAHTIRLARLCGLAKHCHDKLELLRLHDGSVGGFHAIEHPLNVRLSCSICPLRGDFLCKRFYDRTQHRSCESGLCLIHCRFPRFPDLTTPRLTGWFPVLMQRFGRASKG